MNSFDLGELEKIFSSYEKEVEHVSRPVPAAKTGILSVDYALGGGLPGGLTEVFGPPSCGKTALCGSIISHNQRVGRPTGWLHSETVDLDYLQRLDVDLSALPLLTAETALTFLEDFSDAVVVVDSLTALRPIGEEDMNGFVYDFLLDVQDRLLTTHAVIATSHVRTKRSMRRGQAFGRGLDSAARNLTDLFHCRMELGREAVTFSTYTQSLKIVRNVLAPPGRYVLLASEKGMGVDRVTDLIRVAISTGALKQQGSYIKTLSGAVIGQGISAAADRVRADQELMNSVLKWTLERM